MWAIHSPPHTRLNFFLENPVTHIQMHGLNNCDIIKKAKQWLKAAGIEFSFRDYKKHPPSILELQTWSLQVGWELLLNKRGTTWGKLSTEQQKAVNESNIYELLAQNPSMIKRPLLTLQAASESQDELVLQAFCGFKPEQYAIIFKR